jgi:hypothetical protein
MSKRALPGSATEGWHQRVLFNGAHAWGEPDSFSSLSGLGWFDPGRRILTLNIDFLRAEGNLGEPDILLYITIKKSRAGGRTLGMVRTRIVAVIHISSH